MPSLSNWLKPNQGSGVDRAVSAILAEIQRGTTLDAAIGGNEMRERRRQIFAGVSAEGESFAVGSAANEGLHQHGRNFGPDKLQRRHLI